jgi:cytoskeletal protein RodZ
MALVLGVAALVALVVGVGLVLVYGARQAREQEEPRSHPGDYVAPVSSGGYRFREPDESPEQFHARVARESAPPPPAVATEGAEGAEAKKS